MVQVVTNISEEHTTFIYRVEGRMFLRNVGKHLQHYTVSQLRRPQSETSNLKDTRFRHNYHYIYSLRRSK
jgi:hypothetical protein